MTDIKFALIHESHYLAVVRSSVGVMWVAYLKIVLFFISYREYKVFPKSIKLFSLFAMIIALHSFVV